MAMKRFILAHDLGTTIIRADTGAQARRLAERIDPAEVYRIIGGRLTVTRAALPPDAP